MEKESVNLGNAFDLGDIPKVRKVTGARKAAILLITLGADVAADIVKNLPDQYIQKIGVEISNIHKVGTRERREILQEFIEVNKGQDIVLQGGMDFAKSLLNGALGNQRANKILEGIKYDTCTKLFMAARKAEPEQILSCIQGESTQTIAIILSHLQPDKAAVVLSEIPDDIKHEVSLKIGGTSSISPNIIKAIDEAVTNKLSKLGQRDLEKSGGVDSLIDILSNVDENFITEVSNIFLKINKDNILYKKIISGEYWNELYDYLDTIEISKEELEQFTKMVVQCNNFRSKGTLEHSITVEVITYNLYKLLGIVREDMNTILFAAFCHDLGKLLTPIEILEKPAKLTYEEMEIMKDHVIQTGMILKGLGLEEVGRIAEMHHEKLDGTGYPYGLKDEEIPMEAKILAVADILSALMEKRSYKEKFSKDRTLDILQAMAEENKIDKNVVRVVVENYDHLVNICERVKRKNNFKYRDIIRRYNEVNNKYEELCKG